MFHVPEQYRVTSGEFASRKSDGNDGKFWIPFLDKPGIRLPPLQVSASDGAGWEHVSVSTPTRTPLWLEMAHVKDVFWDAEDAVIQYHPPHSEYVNNHPYCLHLWRPNDGREIPLPPSILVGYKDIGVIRAPA